MTKEIRFNDVELLLIRTALWGLSCSDLLLDPTNSQKAYQIRALRKIEKLLEHPDTEFV